VKAEDARRLVMELAAGAHRAVPPGVPRVHRTTYWERAKSQIEHAKFYDCEGDWLTADAVMHHALAFSRDPDELRRDALHLHLVEQEAARRGLHAPPADVEDERQKQGLPDSHAARRLAELRLLETKVLAKHSMATLGPALALVLEKDKRRAHLRELVAGALAAVKQEGLEPESIYNRRTIDRDALLEWYRCVSGFDAPLAQLLAQSGLDEEAFFGALLLAYVTED
jgi:hypothetical protein